MFLPSADLIFKVNFFGRLQTMYSGLRQARSGSKLFETTLKDSEMLALKRRQKRI